LFFCFFSSSLLCTIFLNMDLVCQWLLRWHGFVPCVHYYSEYENWSANGCFAWHGIMIMCCFLCRSMLFLRIYFEVYCKCFPVECGIPIAIVVRLPFPPLHPHIHCTCVCVARGCWLRLKWDCCLIFFHAL
jgi:hypothetical protein